MFVKTKSGKQFKVDHCVATMFNMQPLLYIEFIGYQMMDIVPIFSDVNENQEISAFVDDKLQQTYSNYTIFAEIFIVPENGNLRIRLDAPIQVLGQ